MFFKNFFKAERFYLQETFILKNARVSLSLLERLGVLNKVIMCGSNLKSNTKITQRNIFKKLID